MSVNLIKKWIAYKKFLPSDTYQYYALSTYNLCPETFHSSPQSDCISGMTVTGLSLFSGKIPWTSQIESIRM